MRQHIAFRPQVWEILEPRAVPSMAGVSIPTGIPGVSVTLPKQISTTSPQVQAAFAAFDQSYIDAVDNLLLATGPNGQVVVVTGNRAAFNTAIEQSLETLAQQLVQSLGTTSTGSTSSTAANQIVDAIVGTGTNSLESQLLALPTAAISLNVPVVLNTNGASQTIVPLVVDTAEVVRPTNRVPVVEGVLASNVTIDVTSPSTSSNAADDIRSAFGNFLNDYFKAVQGVLLAPDATGQVNPQAHRGDFNVKVNQALQSLESRLTNTVGRYPAISALGPQIQAAIEGNGAASLKNGLANLATPESSQAIAVRDFTLSSTQAIAQALSLISGDVSKLLSPAAK
jgi:hypothetical protein